MTKLQLIQDAVSIVSSFPQNITTAGGSTLFQDSATSYYDRLLPAFLEVFIYGFGLVRHTLDNPVTDERAGPNNQMNYRWYNLPSDVSTILFVNRRDLFPRIMSIVGANTYRRLPTEPYQVLTFGDKENSNAQGKRIQIPLTIANQTSADMPLEVCYVQKFPDPTIMSESFKNYLVNSIAFQVALKVVQQQAKAQFLSFEARKFKLEAQTFALKNAGSFEYIRSGLASAALQTQPAIEYPDKGETYKRGL